MTNDQKPQIDFAEFFKETEETAESLAMVNIPENIGLTKDQIRLVNVLIVNAIKNYHKKLFPETQ